MSAGATAVVLATCAVADSLSFLLLHNGLLTPVFAVMIYGLALEGGLLARGLARPFMALLGDATYALYILHFSIIWYLMVILAIARGRLMSPTTFLLACLFVGVLLAIPTYRYFEIPMRRVIRRRLQRSAST
jgi:peptidoglycan/LPS O-acetylase OafA/YrhL